jgi:hypothetical protein
MIGAKRQVVESSSTYSFVGYQREMEALKKLSPAAYAYLEKKLTPVPGLGLSLAPSQSAT